MASLTILIFANPYDAAVLRRAVRDADLEAEVGRAEGIAEQLEAYEPLAVVLDYGLSARPCDELLAELRRGEQEPIPVILLATARRGPQTLAEALDFGADHLLLRPLEPAVVSDKLKGLAARVYPKGRVGAGRRRRPRTITGVIDARGVALPAPTPEPTPAPSPAPSREPPRAKVTRPKRPITGPRRRKTTAVDLSPLVDDGPADVATATELAPPPAGADELLARQGQLVDAALALPQEGALGAVGLPALLRLLHARGFSGALEVRRDGIEKTIVIDDGYPVFARSNAAHDRLGELLMREGRLDEERLTSLMEEQRGSRRRLGALLVEHQVVKQDELFPLVRRHVLEIIFSLFGWSSGRFSLVPGEVDEERIRLEVHPAAIILEGIRRKVGRAELYERLGGGEIRVRLATGSAEGLEEAGLEAPEAELATLLAGEQTLSGLVGLGILDELRAYQLVYALQILGLAVVRGSDVQVPYGELTDKRQLELSVDGRRIAAKLAQVREGDYFALLGLRSDASRREVVQAYRRLCNEMDPRKLPPELLAQHGDALSTIREVLDEAFVVLATDELRVAYRDASGQ